MQSLDGSGGAGSGLKGRDSKAIFGLRQGGVIGADRDGVAAPVFDAKHPAAVHAVVAVHMRLEPARGLSQMFDCEVVSG
jgi:hypothetical protein